MNPPLTLASDPETIIRLSSDNAIVCTTRAPCSEKVRDYFNQFPADLLTIKFELQGERITPLEYAIYADAIKSFIEILNRIPIEKINEPNQNGETPLFYAVGNFNKLYTKLLLARGANPNASNNNGTTPLMAASIDSNPKAIKLLLRYGADINEIDDVGDSAIDYFITHAYVLSGPPLNKNQFNTFNLLLNKVKNINEVNNDSQTLLMLAAKQGIYELVVALLLAGADITLTDKDHKNAQDLAQEQLNRVSVHNKNLISAYRYIIYLLSNPSHAIFAQQEILSAFQAPANYMPSSLKQSLVMGNHKESMEYLENNPEDLESVDISGNTPLMIASEHAHDAIVESLIQMGAKKNAHNDQNKTALTIAIKNVSCGNDETKIEKLKKIIMMLNQG